VTIGTTHGENTMDTTTTPPPVSHHANDGPAPDLPVSPPERPWEPDVGPIRTPDQKLRVFVSSTLGELAPERAAVSTAIRTLRLSPVMFELGARPHPPRDLYRSYLSQSQVFVGIYWQSYGWVAPDSTVSGIEDEYLLSGDRPKLIYVKEPATNRDRRLDGLLDRIRSDGRVSYTSFTSPGDLAELILDDLALLQTERFVASDADALPDGDVTFLFGDIEESTRLLEQHGEGYRPLLDHYRSVVRGSVAAHRGHLVDFEGDGAFAVFSEAGEAATAAVEIQRQLTAADQERGVPIRARIGIHSGHATPTAEGYIGLDVHRANRIATAGHGGQIVVSSTTRALVEDIAHHRSWRLHDLGNYALKGLSRTERLTQLDAPGLVAHFPPPRARNAARIRLPAQLTSLVDRTREVDEISTLLSGPGVRLVTLTGTGGIGKTRLALAVAERVASDYPDGVFFVNLAAATDPTQVLPTIAETLGLPIEGTAVDTLVEQLALDTTLLILDNLEQVAGAAPDVVDLLGRCPGLDVLVTSRVVLRIGGEHEYPVGPLEVPAPWVADPALIAETPAVALFVERARAVRPGFQLTDGNRTAVVDIVRLVDGLPLAVELAAARLRLFPPVTLADRLRRSLDALGGGITDLPERQQTLRATVDWSHDLLDDTERTVLRRIAVFAGTWTLVGAAAVVGEVTDDLAGVVEALIDHSLVLPAPGVDGGDGEPRFRLLATIREYAQERMVEAGEADSMRGRHIDHILAVVGRQANRLNGVEQVEGLRVLDAEWTDIQAVAERLVAERRWATLVRLLHGLWIFMWLRGHVTEATRWLDSTETGSLSQGAHGRWLWLRACAAFERGDYTVARTLLDESLDRVPESDVEVRAWAGYLRAALLPVFDQDVESLHSEFELARQRMRTGGDQWGEGWALSSLGMRATSSGDIEAAERYYLEGLALAESLRSESMLGQFHTQLAFAHLVSGRLDEAHHRLALAVDVYRRFHFREGLAYALEALAMLRLRQDLASEAMIALGAAEGIRSRLGINPWPSVQWVSDMLTATANGLADPELQAARLAGAQMDPVEAAIVALRNDKSAASDVIDVAAPYSDHERRSEQPGIAAEPPNA